MKKQTFERYLRHIIREERRKLQELDVTDPELIKKAKRMAELANNMKVLLAQLKDYENEYTPLDDEFRQLVEAVGTTKDTFIRAGNLLITIERAGYDKSSKSYKTGFEYLYNKVNGVMKDLAEEALKLTEGVSYVKSKISVIVDKETNESRLMENSMITKIKTWIVSKFKKLFNLNKTANAELDKLEKML